MNNTMMTDTLPLNMTDAAYAEIVRLISEIPHKDNAYLRIGVKGGGCSGMSYVLGFDKMEEDDALYQYKDIKAVIKPLHLIYLEKMVIDYSNGLDARGFIFDNPNASSSCGCGTSFAV